MWGEEEEEGEREMVIYEMAKRENTMEKMAKDSRMKKRTRKLLSLRMNQGKECERL